MIFGKLLNLAKKRFVLWRIGNDSSLGEIAKRNMLVACRKNNDAVDMCFYCALRNKLDNIQHRFLNRDLKNQFFVFDTGFNDGVDAETILPQTVFK